MQTLIADLQQLCHRAAQRAFPQLSSDILTAQVDVTQSTQDKFGHYQCNAAMKLAKTLGKPPRAIAEALVQALHALAAEDSRFSQVEIAGPGFINLALSSGFLDKRLNALVSDPRLGIPLPKKKQKIAIDFSSPNTAKELHVGHLRSTLIGDCLARVFEFLGYEVLRLNHVGDWGTQFGMLIAYMKEKTPQVLLEKEQTDLSHLVEWYRASKIQFDQDEAFKTRARQEVVALQRGEPSSLKAWQLICSISRKAYQEIYDLLDIKIIERGESFYNPMLASTITDLEQKGLITLSDGAKCLFLEGFKNREGEPLPLMLQKSDGGYNYDTTDMATIQHRLLVEKADRLIYVTDAGQSVHFQMIFKAAEKAGYFDPSRVRVDHVPFGLVLGADGKKFRTRSGDTERLIDLLQAAIDRAEALLHERNPELSEAECKRQAHLLGISAIKYADLSTHRVSDYTFSYERMLRFDGNTALFVLYSYVRIEGIKRKTQVDMTVLRKEASIALQHPSEIQLGLHLLQFPEMLEGVAQDLLPNRITDYLFALAEKFNAFFRDCRVEGSPEQSSRLLLCDLTSRMLKQGLALLGIATVDKL